MEAVDEFAAALDRTVDYRRGRASEVVPIGDRTWRFWASEEGNFSAEIFWTHGAMLGYVQNFGFEPDGIAKSHEIEGIALALDALMDEAGYRDEGWTGNPPDCPARRFGCMRRGDDDQT